MDDDMPGLGLLTEDVMTLLRKLQIRRKLARVANEVKDERMVLGGGAQGVRVFPGGGMDGSHIPAEVRKRQRTVEAPLYVHMRKRKVRKLKVTAAEKDDADWLTQEEKAAATRETDETTGAETGKYVVERVI